MKQEINFTNNLSTIEAMRYICLLVWQIAKNICRAINRAVHWQPWLFIAATIFTAIIISAVMVSKARAERDHYSKKAYEVQQQLDSLSIMLE